MTKISKENRKAYDSGRVIELEGFEGVEGTVYKCISTALSKKTIPSIYIFKRRKI
jgi:hypothetical protein